MSNYLIVGLGNHPEQYKNSRHNAGYLVVDHLAHSLNLSFNKENFSGVFCSFCIDDNKFFVVKPITFMNLSGDCVSAMMNYYKIDIKNIIVVCDDADAIVGTLRIRKDGSSGGQNGLKDIINKINSDKFIRIKIGIGRPTNSNVSLADYVLSNFLPEEKLKINTVVNKAVEMIMHYINGKPIDYLISQYNRVW